MGKRTLGTSKERKRNILGPFLRQVRNDKNLSAEEVAARIELFNIEYDFEVSANHLHKVERQEKPLTDLLILAYSEAIGIDVAEIFEVYKESKGEC